jgi:pimeloyl-ACP methyl ester carboxylesterase
MKTMIELKNEIPIRLVVIDSGFLSYRSAAKSVLASHWMTWPLQPAASWAICDSGAPGDQISKISSTSWPTPWVIIHGDQDRVIDISLGEEVYQKAPDPKEFWRIHQGGHTDALWRTDDQNVRARLLSKLDSIFCLAPCRPRPLQYEPWMVRRLPNTQPPVWPDE